MKRRINSLVLFGLLTVFFGCQLPGPEYYDELDIIVSNYDQSFDFKGSGTYSIPDKIIIIDGDPSSDEYVKDIYGVPMLAQMEANMNALGWTKVDVGATPDVQLLPAAWSTTTVVGGYYGNYWCWYYYYYCGGGWYYPYSYYSSYTTGTLVMTLVDANSNSANESKTVVWTGAINSLLQSTSDVTRIASRIDQAFIQSPYLKTN